MNLKYIKINTDYHYIDGTNFDFSFFGTTENINLDQEQLEKNIQNIFKNRKTSPTLIEATTILKTLFQNIQESHFIINIYKDKVFSQSVNYWLSKLGIYYYHQEITPENHLDIRIDYSAKQGIKVNVTDQKDNILDNTNIELLEHHISTIYQLQHIKSVKLSPADEILILVYRLFFKENPNFTVEENRLKTHYMLAFLEEFGIELYDDNNEELIFDFDYQNYYSPKLEQQLYKLSIFGEITHDINKNILSTRSQNVIKIISQKIRENMKNNSIQWFQNLIKLTYAKNYCLPSNADIYEMAEYTNIEEESVKQNVKILSKIKDEMKANQ